MIKITIPTLSEILQITKNEEATITYSISKELLFPFSCCEVCSGSLRRVGKNLRCSTKNCRKRTSILKYSFFNDMKLKLNRQLFLCYHFCARASNTTTQAYTGHSQSTVSLYFHRIRDLICSSLETTSKKVGGPGIVVEIDESKFGKVKNHRGHKVDGVWILGGVEKTPERGVFIQIVDSRDQVTLIGLIKQHVHPGSIVRTDLWKGYKNLMREMDVIHETVNHKLYFKDPVTQVHTNTIEGTWAGIKVNISASQRTKKYIKEHLATFLWRRENSGNIWEGIYGAA